VSCQRRARLLGQEVEVDEEMTAHDRRTRRCPMLGHGVAFAYCRSPGADLPCRKVFDCWWETFDVQAFIRRHFSDEQISRILQPRPDKMSTLVELIQKARQSRGE
jgi:hypothetical protein